MEHECTIFNMKYWSMPEYCAHVKERFSISELECIVHRESMPEYRVLEYINQ